MFNEGDIDNVCGVIWNGIAACFVNRNQRGVFACASKTHRMDSACRRRRRRDGMAAMCSALPIPALIEGIRVSGASAKRNMRSRTDNGARRAEPA